ncbi:DoxX family membrane protein [Candidatus Nanohaloarchaea archaeon]|nr:DoxX family membrane protein [Candidatus Nanohaloarchaea archaeon]
MLTDSLKEFLERYSEHSSTVFRLGIGTVILFSGVHKLVNPAVWASYIAPVFADLMSQIGLTGTLFMKANGVFEILFGAALTLDKYTTVAAGLVTLSMAGIILNLALGGAGYMDVIIRDIGLLLLALGVTLQSARREKE